MRRSAAYAGACAVALAVVLAGSAGAQEPSAPVGDAEGWQGLLGSRPGAGARGALDRGAPREVARRPRPSCGRRRRRDGDEGVDRNGSTGAGARAGTARLQRGADPARAPIPACPERVCRLHRHRRPPGHPARPVGRRRLPGEGRLSGGHRPRRAGNGRGERPADRCRDTRLRRVGCHRRPLDTGVDFDHPYIGDALLPGIDIVDPGGLAEPGENPNRGREAGAARNRVGRARRGRGARQGCTGSRRAHFCARCASRAGSRTATGVSRSTRAPTRCSPAWRRRSIRITTATRTTPRASPSSAWSSPHASFADAPLARAAAGALALDMLVVGTGRQRRSGGTELRERRSTGLGGSCPGGCGRRHSPAQSHGARPAAHGAWRPPLR